MAKIMLGSALGLGDRKIMETPKLHILKRHASFLGTGELCHEIQSVLL